MRRSRVRSPRRPPSYLSDFGYVPLLSAYAAAAALEGFFGAGTLSIGGTAQSAANYLLGSLGFICEPTDTGCALGDVINTTEYRAQVNMFERNAMWTVLGSTDPTPVPEPATIVTLSLGLGAIARARRRGKRSRSQT